MKILKDIFTGIDGESHDAGKYLWVLSVLAGLDFAGYDLVWLKSPFNIINFGIGVGSLLGAGAAALKFKETTEPK